MKCIEAFGPSAEKILAEARSELFGNAKRYAESDMCWGLTDLRGTAKKFSGTYARARATAEEAIQRAARKRRYVFERADGEGGWRMELRPRTLLERARRAVEPFALTVPADDPITRLIYPFHLRKPTAKQVKRAMKAGPDQVRLALIGDTVTLILSKTDLGGYDHRKPQKPKSMGVRIVDVLS